jgi:tetratricopeptide (TPR) repeat protein
VAQGIVFAEQGNHQDAIDAYNRAIELDPNNVAAHIRQGDAYNALGNTENAIAAFTRAIEISPTDWAYANRGTTYTGLEQYELAQADFDRAIELAPDNPYNYFVLGENYSRQEQYEEAIVAYTQAINLEPNFAHFYHGRGYAYNGLGQYEQSVVDFRQAIALDETNIDVYAALGDVYYTIGRYDEALPAYVQHIQRAGENAYDYVVQRVAELEAQIGGEEPETVIGTLGSLGGIIRSVSSPTGGQLETLEAGQQIAIFGISPDGEYYRVESNGQVGWLSRSFIREIQGDLNNLPVVEADVLTAIIGSLGAIIRAAPTPTAEFLGSLLAGDQITITDISADGEYYRVQYNGQVGWLSRSFIREVQGDLSALPRIEVLTAIIGSLGGIIRTTPTPTGEFLGSLLADDQLAIFGVSPDGEYYRVEFNGQVGWLSRSFIREILGDPSTLPVVNP